MAHTPTYLDYAPRRAGRPIPRGEACFTGRGYSSRLAARWWEHVAKAAVRHIGRLLLDLAKEKKRRIQAERELREWKKRPVQLGLKDAA